MVTLINAGFEGEPMASNGNVVDSSIEPPYLQSFDDRDAFNTFKVIDLNKDGKIWEWGQKSWTDAKGMAIHNLDYEEADCDDWLLTPPIHVQAHKTYTLTFKARSMNWQGDFIEVAFGPSEDVSKYKSLIPCWEMPFTNGFTEYSAKFSADTEQDIRIGFHRIAEYVEGGNMQIDDIRMPERAFLHLPLVKDLILVRTRKANLKLMSYLLHLPKT